MWVKDFEYADKRLSDFGFIICSINTDSGFRDVETGHDITFNTVKNNYSSKQYITSSTYENVYTTSFDIIKNVCGNNGKDMYCTSDEIRRLNMWLNRREYRKLKFIGTMDSDYTLNYFGSFNTKQIMNGDKIVGLSLTFTSNAPYAFADEIILKYDISSEYEHFYLSGDGDELGYVYPKVSIYFPNECKKFQLLNISTGTKIELRNCSPDETIVIDGELKFIQTNEQSHKDTIYNDFNYEYLDILVDEDYSVNKYEVSSPCEITITYSPIRKVGVF